MKIYPQGGKGSSSVSWPECGLLRPISTQSRLVQTRFFLPVVCLRVHSPSGEGLYRLECVSWSLKATSLFSKLLVPREPPD